VDYGESIKVSRREYCVKRFRLVVLILIVIVGLFLLFVYWAFYDMGRLPKGELITSVDSPSNEYTVKIYQVNGGATVSYSIRGELNFNQKNRKPKNIYWNYREEDAEVEWLDEDTIIINKHTLNVPNDVYDWRREN